MAPLIPTDFDPNTTPGEAPPPGVLPNFVDPPSAATAALVVCIVMLSLEVLFAGTRLYTNIRSHHKLHLDDCTSSYYIQ